MKIMAHSSSPRRAGAVLCALLLGSAVPVLAEDGQLHPVDSALKMMDLKTEPGPMPDFVTQQRGTSAAGAYIPVGAKPPARSLKPKSATDVKALTAELDAARDAQVAGKRPKPMSAGAPATSAKTVGKPLKLQSSPQATNR